MDDFYHFIFDCSLNKSVVISLICSGALDSFGIPRDRMLHEYKLFKQLTVKQQEIVKKLFAHGNCSVIFMVRELADEAKVESWKEQGIRPPNVRGREKLRTLIAEYEGAELLSNQQILDMEREFLGISTSPRPMPQRGSHTCLSLKTDFLPDAPVYVTAYITHIHIFKTKKNEQDMAFISIEDDTYGLDGVVVFPKLYEDVSSILSEERFVHIWGKMDAAGTLICDRMVAE